MKNILVIGPVCEDVWREVLLESNPDGPYPKFALNAFGDKESITQLGCAGNVAVNLSRLGHQVTILNQNVPMSAKRTTLSLNSEGNDRSPNPLFSFSSPGENYSNYLESWGTKERFIDPLTKKPYIRIDYSTPCEQISLNNLKFITYELQPNAIYLADYEAKTATDGIAPIEVLREYLKWVHETLQSTLTFSDSRRTIYNTYVVKTNRAEWEEKIKTHFNLPFETSYLRSMGSSGVEFWLKDNQESMPRLMASDLTPSRDSDTVSTCGAGDVLASVFLDRMLNMDTVSLTQAISDAHRWASESTTRPYTCRVSLAAQL